MFPILGHYVFHCHVVGFVAGPEVNCRRSGSKVSPVCVFPFTCDGKRPLSACSVAGWLPTVAGPGAKCRRSAFFRSPATENGHSAPAVSQVGRILRTSDVPCFYLRREMATQSPAVSQVGCQLSQVRGQSVAGLRFSVHLRRSVPSPATENGHPVSCSVAGRAIFADLRRSGLSPATGNGHSAPVASQVGCQLSQVRG